MTTPVNIPNESGKDFRLDSNERAIMLGTLFAGASEPEILGSGQLWADTYQAMLKVRSLDNSKWFDLWPLDMEYSKPVTATGGHVMEASLWRQDRKDLQLLADESNIDVAYGFDLNNILDAGQVVLENPDFIQAVLHMPPNNGRPFVVESFNTGSVSGFQRFTEIGSLTFWGREYTISDDHVISWSDWAQVKANANIQELGAATESIEITGDVYLFLTSEWRASGFYHSAPNTTNNPNSERPFTLELNVITRTPDGILHNGTLKAQEVGGAQVAYVQSILDGEWASDWARVYEGAGGVNSVNYKTGDVMLTPADLGLYVTDSYHDSTPDKLLKVGDFNIGLTESVMASELDFSSYQFAIGETFLVQLTSALNVPPEMDDLGPFTHISVIGVADMNNDCAIIATNYEGNQSIIFGRTYDSSSKTVAWKSVSIGGYLSADGDDMYGQFKVHQDSAAIEIVNKTQGFALYIMARDYDLTNRWYIGNGSTNTETVSLTNYIGGNSLSLNADGSISLNFGENKTCTISSAINATYYASNTNTGAGSYASQYPSFAPLFSEFASSSSSEYHPLWKQRSNSTGDVWSGGILVSAGDFVIHHIQSDGTRQVEFYFRDDGSFTCSGRINASNVSVSDWSNFDERYLRKSEAVELTPQESMNSEIDNTISKVRNIVFELQCKQFDDNATDEELAYMKDLARYISTLREKSSYNADGFYVPEIPAM